MSTRLLILTEAGQNIGFGHYMRCKALMDYFISRGREVKMLLDVKGNYSFEDCIALDWTREKDVLRKYTKQYTYVLIDSYLAKGCDYIFLSEYFEKVIAMDDYNRLSYDADVILNPNIYGNEMDYSNQRGEILAGKECIILRKEFRDCKDKIRIREEVKNILVTLGGSDVRGMVPILIDWLKDKKVNVTVVAGNEPYKDQLIDKFGNTVDKVLGFTDANTMLTSMLNADLVISACGQTLHELAYLGVPAIGVLVGEDQLGNMKKYVELGFLQQEIYWNDPDLILSLEKAFLEITSKEKRLSVSVKGKSIVSGEGVKHIYQSLFMC